jgi:hypothetical protein
VSSRNDNLESLKTTLGNITISNGFNYTVSKVERKFLYFDAVFGFPVLMVLGGDEEFEDQLGDSTGSTMSVRIVGYTKDKQEPEVALCNLLEDVLTCLENTTYNPLKAKMRPIRVDTDEGLLHEAGEGVGMFILTLEIIYVFKRSTP